MREKDGGFQRFGQFLVFCKFAAVVGGYRFDGADVWRQFPDRSLQHIVSIFTVGQFGDDGVIDAAFDQREHGIFLACPDDKVHLPVAKARAIGLWWALVDARSVGDIGRFGRSLFLLSSSIA